MVGWDDSAMPVRLNKAGVEFPRVIGLRSSPVTTDHAGDCSSVGYQCANGRRVRAQR